jgi:hypothetical protein
MPRPDLIAATLLSPLGTMPDKQAAAGAPLAGRSGHSLSPPFDLVTRLRHLLI